MSDFVEPILHADMDAFFVEVERQRDPSLRGKPVVVGGAGRRGVVAAASYEARPYGIRSAMSMAEARAGCPHLVIVPPDHQRYAEVSARVFAVFRSFSPLVEGLAFDEAFIDIAGLRRHYRSPEEVGHALRAAIRRDLDLPVSVGIGVNKLVAKLASEKAKPDGLYCVRREQTLSFLHPLPVRAIGGVGEATHAALEGLGVSTIGDLAATPESTLVRRLGIAAGKHLGQLARGIDERPVLADSPTKSVSVSETYEYDLETPEQVETELLRLCDRLGSRLHIANQIGTTVTMTVRYSDFETITRQHRQGQPIASAHDLWQAAKELRTRFDWGRPVRLLGVAVSQMQDALAPTQLSTDLDPRWDTLSGSVEEARARFGSDAVRPARVVLSNSTRERGKTGK
jgi:DNA polymerase-4